jgi:hypothetical protein
MIHMVTKRFYHQVCGMTMAIGLMGITNCFFPLAPDWSLVIASAVYVGLALGFVHYSDHFIEQFGITDE